MDTAHIVIVERVVGIIITFLIICDKACITHPHKHKDMLLCSNEKT